MLPGRVGTHRSGECCPGKGWRYEGREELMVQTHALASVPATQWWLQQDEQLEQQGAELSHQTRCHSQERQPHSAAVCVACTHSKCLEYCHCTSPLKCQPWRQLESEKAGPHPAACSRNVAGLQPGMWFLNAYVPQCRRSSKRASPSCSSACHPTVTPGGLCTASFSSARAGWSNLCCSRAMHTRWGKGKAAVKPRLPLSCHAACYYIVLLLE